MKKKISWILLGVELVFLIAAAAVIFFFRRYNAPSDRDVIREPIESVVISSGGGYGTRAGTQRIEMRFIGNQVTLQTHLGEYDGKEETDLIQGVDASDEVIEELYSLVQDNLWELQNNLKESRDVLDAGVTYISVNGETYGGYAIMNVSFNDIVSKAYEIVGRDNLMEFRRKIAEWYGEE